MPATPPLCPLKVIMPGYCVQGTVGHKILSGQRKLEMEGRQLVSFPPLLPPALLGPSRVGGDGLVCCDLQLEVKMQVEYMSFSAHADAKGIMQLVRQAEPESVLLVHGEAKKMEFLKQKIEQEFRRLLRGAGRGRVEGRVGRAGSPTEAVPAPWPRSHMLHASQWRDGDTAHESLHPGGHLVGAAEAGDGTGYEGGRHAGRGAGRANCRRL